MKFLWWHSGRLGKVKPLDETYILNRLEWMCSGCRAARSPADAAREALAGKGIVIIDTENGPVWKRTRDGEP